MEEDVHSIQLGKKGKTISVNYHFLPTVSAKVTANFQQKQSRVESRYSWVPAASDNDSTMQEKATYDQRRDILQIMPSTNPTVPVLRTSSSTLTRKGTQRDAKCPTGTRGSTLLLFKGRLVEHHRISFSFF